MKDRFTVNYVYVTVLLAVMTALTGCAALPHIVAVGITTFLRLRDKDEERATPDEKTDVAYDGYDAIGILSRASDLDGRSTTDD